MEEEKEQDIDQSEESGEITDSSFDSCECNSEDEDIDDDNVLEDFLGTQETSHFIMWEKPEMLERSKKIPEFTDHYGIKKK